MYLMSHNSWSFLTPKTFLGKCFNFMAKCQSANIQQQYLNYDVRMFDLRVRLDNDSKPTLTHGLFEYKNSFQRISTDLDFLNSKSDATVRVFLEVRNDYQDTEVQRHWFTSFCSHLEDKWPNINFCGGNPTYTGNILIYKFKGYTPTTIGKHASWATKCKIDDLWPWLYARLFNRKSRREFKESSADYLSLDFVNIK